MTRVTIGVDLASWQKKGLIRFVAARPVLTGLEGHLASIHKQVREFDPKILIIDPISDLSSVGTERDAKAMMVRLMDFLKSEQITAVLINLHGAGGKFEETDMGISSIIDTWLFLRDIESNGERNRGLYILKARGTAHSNQIREFLITKQGIKLRPAYIGPEGVLTGSARLTQESRDQAEAVAREEEIERRKREIERRRRALEMQIETLRSELDLAEHEENTISEQAERRRTRVAADQEAMARSRKVASTSINGRARRK